MRKILTAAVAGGAGLMLLAIAWFAGMPHVAATHATYDELPVQAQPERIDVEKVSVASESANAAGAAPRSAPRTVARNAPQIARTGQIDLYVGNVDDAVAVLSELAHRQGGDLFALNVQNASDAAASATMQIRVPSDRFEQTMNDVARSGKVRDRSIGAQDLTGDLSDSAARLTNLRQTEADIRKIMDREGEISDVLTAENQLSDVRGQIEELESQLKSMRDQVSYATISVSLQAEAGTLAVDPTASSQLAASWQAAVRALSHTTLALAALVLWLVAFAPYIALGAFVAWMLVRASTAMRSRIRRSGSA